MNKTLVIALLTLLSNNTQAQATAEIFYSTGKIYVVTAVISIILIILFILFWRLERNLKRLEKEIKNEN